MKRVISLILSLAMVFSFATTAFAAGEASITIEKAQVGETYTIWKLFDVDSYVDGDTNEEDDEVDGATDTDKFVYTINADSDWYDFVVASGRFVLTATTTDANPAKYYVAENKEVTTDWAKFAQDAVAYATAEAITETAKKVAPGEVTPGVETPTTTVTFEGLDLGYYLIDSTMGVLCALNSTEPNVKITEKNQPPKIDKNVMEDSSGEWTDVNDADINQVVDYVTVVTVENGAYGYEVHDKMTNGLTFNAGSVKVYALKDAEPLKLEEYAALTPITNYTVTAPATCVWPGTTENCDFVVDFADDYMKGLGHGDFLHVVYNATVNENAVVAVPELNDVYLKYGESSYTTIIETETYTWDIDVLKYGDGKESEVLEGAEFVILKEVTEDNTTKTLYALTKTVEDRIVIDKWVEATEAMLKGTEEFNEAAVLTTGDDGKIMVDGLDADTYKLKEVKAPTGYNKLREAIDFTVTAGTKENNTIAYETAVVKVNNQSGAELPSTGGMGTTLFYIVGAAMVLGSAVVFVTKKRMGEAE